VAQAFDPAARPEFLGFTSRSRKLQELHDLYLGKQYEGRPDWWTGLKGNRGDPVPLRERKPCTIYRLPEAATKQVVRFLYGDGRFPTVTVDRPDDTDDGGVAISEDNQKLLEEWFANLIEAARIKPIERQRAQRCISIGTAVTIVSLRDGKFVFEHPLPQNCWAEFRHDDPDDAVTRLVWCYSFLKEVVEEKTGKPCEKLFMFRREWDDSNVYVYDDVEVPAGQQYEKIAWGEPKIEPHGLSFCPVIWTRNEADDANGVDGRSLFGGSEEELEALDLTLSRRHQGLIYLGSPQLVETGVKEDDGPDADGVRGSFNMSASAGEGSNPHGSTDTKRRRTGPDTVWTYHGEKVKLELLETSGKAFEVATKHVDDLRSRLLETWGVVLTSMSDTISRVTTGAEMSAKFLALAHAPLIGLVQEYRHNYWANSLEPLLIMCLRICAEASGPDADGSPRYILIPKSDKVAEIVRPMLAVDVGGSTQWQPPRLKPEWGQFFEPSSQEISQRADAATKASDGKLITGKTATAFIAHDFGIENVDEERDEIEDERSNEDAAAAEREDREIRKLEQRAMSSGGVGTGRGRSAASGDQAGSDSRSSDGPDNAPDAPASASDGDS